MICVSKPADDSDLVISAGQRPHQIVARAGPGDVRRADPRLEDQAICAAIALNDGVAPGAKAEDIDIVTRAALQGVVSGAAVERIVSSPAQQLIVASIA